MSIVLTSALLFISRYFKKILKLVNSSKTVKLLYLDQRIQHYLDKKMVTKKVYDLSGFRYEPVTYEAFVLIFDRLKKRIIADGYEESPLLKNMEDMMNHLRLVIEHADKSCCGQIRANGYFSMCRLIYKYLECLDNDLSMDRSSRSIRELIANFNLLTDLTSVMLNIIYQIMEDTNLEDEQKRLELDEELLKYPEFHRNLKFFRQIMVTKQSSDDNLINNNSINGHINNNYQNDTIVCKNSFSTTAINQEFNSLPFITAKISTTCDGTYEAIVQPNTRHKEIVFREYFMCWLDTGLVKFFKIFTLSLVFLKNRIYRYPHLILSSRARAKNLNKILRLDIVFFCHLNLLK